MTRRPPSHELLQSLQAKLGPKGYTCDPAEMQPWLTDWRGTYHGAAAAMLSPGTTDDVATIVRLCAAEGVALVPQGGNSGMVGGATPDTSGHQLLLSLRRLNRIRHFDSDQQIVTTEAGVILAHLHDYAAERGLRFPLTLGGKGSATVGGLISTNAGGTQVLRHGTMRALVAGVEAVLPDGQIWNGLAPLKKDNRGYDLRHLLCGAEGTLGVITAATLRLVPGAPARATAWVGLASPEQALHLLRRLDAAAGPVLEGFEILPHEGLASVLDHVPQTLSPLGASHNWYVLIEMAGPDDSQLAEVLEGNLAEALQSGEIADAAIANSHRESEAFWRLRDSLSESQRAKGPALQHDISVPVDLVPQFIADNPGRLTAAFPGVTTLAFGHLGDGNVHYHVRPPADVDGAEWLKQHGKGVSRLVYQHVLDLGGSLSAEHGIGQMKRDIMAELNSPARLAALRAIKTGLDPAGLFNPGKLITLPDA